MLNDHDHANFAQILADTAGQRYHNFDSMLLRLICKADAGNREKLRELWPEEVEAVENFKAGKLAGAR